MSYQSVVNALKSLESINQMSAKEADQVYGLPIVTIRDNVEHQLDSLFSYGVKLFISEINHILRQEKKDVDFKMNEFLKYDFSTKEIFLVKKDEKIILFKLEKDGSQTKYAESFEGIAANKEFYLEKGREKANKSFKSQEEIVAKIKEMFGDILLKKSHYLNLKLPHLLSEQGEDPRLEVNQYSIFERLTVLLFARGETFSLEDLKTYNSRKFPVVYKWSCFEDEKGFENMREALEYLVERASSRIHVQLEKALNKEYKHLLTHNLVIKASRFTRTPSATLCFISNTITVTKDTTKQELEALAVFYHKVMALQNARSYDFIRVIEPKLKKLKEQAAEKNDIVNTYKLTMHDLMGIECKANQYVRFLEDFLVLDSITDFTFESPFWNKESKQTTFDYSPSLKEFYSFEFNGQTYRHFVLKDLTSKKAVHLYYEDNKNVSGNRYAKQRRKVNK